MSSWDARMCRSSWSALAQTNPKVVEELVPPSSPWGSRRCSRTWCRRGSPSGTSFPSWRPWRITRLSPRIRTSSRNMCARSSPVPLSAPSPMTKDADVLPCPPRSRSGARIAPEKRPGRVSQSGTEPGPTPSGFGEDHGGKSFSGRLSAHHHLLPDYPPPFPAAHERFIPHVIVLSHNEFTAQTQLQSLGTIELNPKK